MSGKKSPSSLSMSPGNGIGGHPVKKQVMFAGVSDDDEDDSDDDSEDESSVDETEERTSEIERVVVEKRKAIMARPVSKVKVNKKVNEGSAGGENIWVLRKDDEAAAAKRRIELQKKRELDAVPVTGVVVAVPKPCQPQQPLMARGMIPTQQQRHMNQSVIPTQPYLVTNVETHRVPAAAPASSSSAPPASKGPPQPVLLSFNTSQPGSKVTSPSGPPPPLPLKQDPQNGAVSRPPKPAPPPRTTAQLSQGSRAPNPVLQRAGGGAQGAAAGGNGGGPVHESPDEGYHEDGDAASEVL